MAKNKDGSLKSQIHLYSTPKLYDDFKEAVKQFNNTNESNYSISEILRVLMYVFTKYQTHRNIISREMEIIQVDNCPRGILYNKSGSETEGDV